VEVGGSTDGSGSVSGGVFHLTARGANFFSGTTTDQFFFYYKSASNMNQGTMFARFTSSSGGDAWAKVGLMVRESVAVGSKGFFCGRYLNQALMISSYRDSTNGSSTSTFSDTLRPWMRLERNGTLFSTAISTDGINWISVHNRITMSLDSALWGLGFVSRSSTAAVAEFQDVTLRDGVCGDGIVQSFEQCDDGNILDGDCCSRWCTKTPSSCPPL